MLCYLKRRSSVDAGRRPRDDVPLAVYRTLRFRGAQYPLACFPAAYCVPHNERHLEGTLIPDAGKKSSA
jgi:hypothetical protein